MSSSLPQSYAALPFRDIKLSHHPASSPTPTPVVVVTLHRPGRHNAFTPTMMEELERTFALVDADDRVRCVVVTGHGSVFCAGADLDLGFVGGKEKINDHRDGGGRVVLAIHRCRKPVIGALQGAAVGVGITMTLPMAIRVAHRDAKVGFVFARRGLVMEACSSYFLPRLIGHSRAAHLTTTGAVYRAGDPLLGPLFTELCDRPGDVLPRALAVAGDVVANTSVVSTNLMKELMWRDAGSAEAQHLLDSRILYELFSSKDNKEGVQSFLEKRPPKFSDTMENDAPAAYPWWSPVDTSGKPKLGLDAKSKL
ncbi:enoyl-hydratase isomerase family protein [Diplodia corticola]|uniref:Enoyl-hydratase isomerase family protein n=1 Tax=Diplodia corticola TaxID=236234 RepID=A0A1J9R2U2_9PEZI|nr:enoyl-hydratase isomerase family protein [Diplodia corticola]OJD35726.1 enoyl-hydratase isomerase family protein [Diplodia corticola]